MCDLWKRFGLFSNDCLKLCLLFLNVLFLQLLAILLLYIFPFLDHKKNSSHGLLQFFYSSDFACFSTIGRVELHS